LIERTLGQYVSASNRFQEACLRATDRLHLTDQIGRELQSRYGYNEIDEFLGTFGIAPPKDVTVNSKWVYSKAALAKTPEAKLLEIASELELAVKGVAIMDPTPPRNWADTKLFRLFISHISKDKDKATRLKACLVPHGITGFVAHEDIHPTLQWQGEIERALRTMDAFIAVLTPGFSASVWTQQEIGFAIGRGVKIISFKMGEDPTGFLSREQALPRKKRTAEEIAKEIGMLLAKDARTADRLLEAIASKQTHDSLDDVPF
jgi:hypothetical protein